MGIFGKKKTGDEGGEKSPAKAAGKGGFQPDPHKAERWFKHARVSHDSTNYEYAMTCWLKGLGCDPANRDALEAFYKSAHAFSAGRSKAGPTKDQVKAVEGKGPVNKYLLALLQWGGKPLDPSAAIKAVEAAGAIRLRESAAWLGEFAIRAARAESKPRKDAFVKLLDIFEKNELWALATKAGEDAVTLDRSDSSLADRVKQTSAKAAMTSGGFDEAGEEGGFRKALRDSETQQKIREQGSVVRTEESSEQIIEEARADYESRSQDRNSIYKYVRALIQRGREEDERLARDILMKGFDDLKEHKMREQAADIELRWGRRKIARYKQALEGAPDDEELNKKHQAAVLEQVKREIKEYHTRVKTYPTETSYKYELGRRLFEVGEYEEAIKYLQEAQSDAKLRVRVLSLLGQSFQKLGWHTEAAGMLKQAAEAHTSADDELALALRYGLMLALEGQAREQRAADAAEEALQIASAIAMKQIGYRDVRQRREELQSLIKELRGE